MSANDAPSGVGLGDCLDRLKCIVVEINPFAEFTGFGLFQWEDDGDRAILQGAAPFQFRVCESVPHVSPRDIAPEWRAFLSFEQGNGDDE